MKLSSLTACHLPRRFYPDNEMYNILFPENADMWIKCDCDKHE